MRQFSDEEQGFIPADIEVKNRQAATRNAQRKQASQKIQYRFSDGFIKKEPQLAYSTPLTLFNQPLTTNPQLDRRQKSKNSIQSPYRQYCGDETYTLCYCRHSGEPFSQQRAYMKNEVSLLNVEDKNSPSLKELKPFEIQDASSNDDSLIFDSRFQCGNLYSAFRRRGTHQYHLFISNDTNSLGYNQWFYFSIRNVKKGVKYSFRIVNYKKMLDFFVRGQRIALFSLKEAQKTNSGWSWNGNNINFQQSTIRVYPQMKMYTLRFDIQIKHSNDFIMLASTLPYSYSRLLHDLQVIEQESKKLEHVNFSVRSICSTVCNNEVPQISITASNSERKEKDRKLIIFMARQHPGQVWSSYMALGVMKSLMKTTPQVKYILQNCVIKIYPMVNVDGVIYGNFRCDATGVDLNRRWKEPSKIFHPQIYEIKRKIQSYSKRSKIQACFDLHGHSKKYNIFCYSCKQNSYTCRILPYLISSQNTIFNIPSCTFGISRDKQSTARAAISKIIRSQNVLTIQTSSFGERVNLDARQFHPNDIFRMGDSIISALRFFIDKKSSKFQESERIIKQNYEKFINYDKENEEESGSDSEPQLDQIDFKIKLNTIFDRKYVQQQKSFAKDSICVQVCSNQLQLNINDRNGLKNQTIDNKKATDGKERLKHSENSKQCNPKSTYKKMNSSNQKMKQQKMQAMQKDSISINQQAQSQPTDKNQQKSGRKVLLKNIFIRDKKRLSVAYDLNEKPEISTINVTNNEFNRSKDFRDIRRQEEDRRSIEEFVNKFQKFIPSNFTSKARGKLDLLQQGLDHDDGQFQLNIMLQNQRLLQLQKLKHRIEESTQIVQRQGKIRWNNKQDPIIDYRRFKRNQRLKFQVRKIGELSQRYLDGRH